MLIPACKETCERRAHLAARAKHGKAFRLCTRTYFEDILADYSRPAIYRCDLSLLVLRLKALGIKNIWNFRYLNQPDEESFVMALEILYSLGAIDENADLTNGMI